MPTAKAPTVVQYLKGLPADRWSETKKVRELIRRHLPKGYRERASPGFISSEVPLSRYPDAYNSQPLGSAALAAQKGHSARYQVPPPRD
jgi:hypothetical protein